MTVALRIEYEVGNASGERALQTLQAALERAGDNVRDLGRYVFPKLIPVFEKAVGRQFDEEGRGPFAGKWAPLTEPYRAWKQANYPGQPTLVRTGTLREALTNSASPFAARDFSGGELVFGTRGVEYASFHQIGTSKMAGRPPFDFGTDTDREMRNAVQKGVVEAIRAADHEGVLGEVTE